MTTVYVAEVAAYDTVGASAVTLYYATHGFTTGPSDTPAHTPVDGVVSQVLNVARHAFAPGATAGRSVVGFGDLRLQNGDGRLDALTTQYAVDGRTLTIRRGTLGAAYPSAFDTVFVGTMEQAEVGRDEVVVRVKDRTFALESAVQGTTFAGDNVLPDGLEGTAEDLKGKPKPLAFGVVKNATLPLVNSAKLIYQLRDGEVQSVKAAYDAGIRLGNRRYGSLALGGKAKLAKFFEAWPDVPQTGLFSSTDGRCLIYALDLWIAGTSDGIYTSPDFVTWTQRETAANIVPNAFAFDGTTVVAVGNSGVIRTSTNGTSWTSRTSGTALSLSAAGFGDGTFVAAGNEGVILTSPTGTTWTAETSPYSGAGRIWNGVTYSTDLDLWVLVGYNSSGPVGLIATAPDATTTWTGRTSGTTLRLQTVAYGNGHFIAGGPDSGVTAVILRSADGLTWENITLAARDAVSEFGAIHEVIFDGERFVGVTSYGSVIASEVGSSWDVWFRQPGSLGGSTDYTHTALAYRDFSAADTYATLADLKDDDLAPEPGTFKWVSHADGSYLRLGSSPLGEITADFTVGATAADRTAAQVFTQVLTRAGYTSSDWVTTDITALDALDDSEIGLFLDRETSIASALDAIANTVGAWWGPRASDGKFRLVRWLAPSGTPALVITANDLAEPLTILPTTDDGRGLPSYKTTLRYAPNWTPQTSGLAAGVTDARRAYLAAQWREVSGRTVAVQTAYLLANATIEETLYVTAADATAEATRRQTLRGVRRRRFRAVLRMDDETLALDVGDVVTLEHPRYGLSAGADFRILGVEPDHSRKRVTLNLWG